jgi:hypothetical protein
MMTRIWLIAALAAAGMSAEEKAAPKKAAAVKKPAAITLPAGATQVEPGTWTHTDAGGKKWIYRQTPFGLSRVEEKPAEAPSADRSVTTKAVEAGDVIKFERPSPFGPYRWEKKKTDLTDDEKAAWEQSRKESKGK